MDNTDGAVAAFALLVCLLTVTPVQAETIIDTGSPATTENGAVSVCGGFTPGSFGYGCTQSVALKFSLANSYDITSVQGYLWSGQSYLAATPPDGTLTIAIYHDANGFPGQDLYNGQVTIPGQLVTPPGGTLMGVQDTKWLLSAGNYWASFEVRSGQSFYGALPFPAPIKLPADVNNPYFGTWTNSGGGAGGGLVITGDLVAPVPTPSSYALMLSGLGVLGVMARKQKRMGVDSPRC